MRRKRDAKPFLATPEYFCPVRNTSDTRSVVRPFGSSLIIHIMKYLLAFICPPVALLSCGKFFQAMLNAAFGCLWIEEMLHPGTMAQWFHSLPHAVAVVVLLIFGSGFFGPLIMCLHAVIVVASENRERRHKEQLTAMNHNASMHRGILRQLAQRQPQVVVIQAPPQPRAVPQPKVITGRTIPPPQPNNDSEGNA